MITIKTGAVTAYELDELDLIRAVRVYLASLPEGRDVYACDMSVRLDIYKSDRGEELIRAVGTIERQT